MFAQTLCPLQLTDVRNIEESLVVVFTNTASSAVTSYEFGLSFQAITGQHFAFPLSLLRQDRVPVGAHRKAVFHSLESLQFLFPLATSYLLKASFADGSSWADDGSHGCSITALQE
jgi:hypothetical protein